MEKMDIIYIILTVILVIIFIIFAKYNKLIKLQNNVKKAKANIEIYLHKRFELIPNLVECVKSYSNYEGETLENIVSLRNSFNEQKDLSIKEAGKMNDSLNRYLAIVESYPELKANNQYMSLQNELKSIEDELEYARYKYNDEVTKYNTSIESVPTNIIASIFAFKKAELFKTDNRENVKIKL